MREKGRIVKDKDERRMMNGRRRTDGRRMVNGRRRTDGRRMES